MAYQHERRARQLLATEVQLAHFKSATLAWLSALEPAPAEKDMTVEDTSSTLIATVRVFNVEQQGDTASRFSNNGFVTAINLAVAGLAVSPAVVSSWRISAPLQPPLAPPSLLPPPSSTSSSAPPAPRAPPAPPSPLVMDTDSNTIAGVSPERQNYAIILISVSCIAVAAALLVLMLVCYRRQKRRASLSSSRASLQRNAMDTSSPKFDPVLLIADKPVRTASDSGHSSPEIFPGAPVRTLNCSSGSSSWAPDEPAPDLPPDLMGARRASAGTSLLLAQMASRPPTPQLVTPDTLRRRVDDRVANASEVKQAALRHIQRLTAAAEDIDNALVV